MPECRERLAGRFVAAFRPVAESEQGLLAALLTAAPRDVQHGIEGEIGRLAPPRRMRESAVMADVGAELRQRDEDLLGEGDIDPMPSEAKPLGGGAQRAFRLAGKKREGLVASRLLSCHDSVEQLADLRAVPHGSVTPIP